MNEERGGMECVGGEGGEKRKIILSTLDGNLPGETEKKMTSVTDAPRYKAAHMSLPVSSRLVYVA